MTTVVLPLSAISIIIESSNLRFFKALISCAETFKNRWSRIMKDLSMQNLVISISSTGLLQIFSKPYLTQATISKTGTAKVFGLRAINNTTNTIP